MVERPSDLQPPRKRPCDTVWEKPSFCNAFRRHHCLFPSNGFYESQRHARGKRPYIVRMSDDQLFAFAELRERTTAFAVTR